MSQAQDELVARATDPNAELSTLHELAQNYPGLRPYIAANPRTYPALLDWLGERRVVPGFGHRLYPQGDVRCRALLAAIAPPPASISCGIAALAVCQTPVRLTSIMSVQSSSLLWSSV